SKELDLLRKQNTLLQDGIKKLKLDVTSKDKDIKDLGKAKEQAEEKLPDFDFAILGADAVEIADAFHAIIALLRPEDLRKSFPRGSWRMWRKCGWCYKKVMRQSQHSDL
uniref:Uncharacterized protein n=1 Tax=Cannabis sativa TaxID=3483 RepID=A0A803QSG8_CANSA